MIVEDRIPIFRPKLPTYRQLEKYISKIDTCRQYSNFGPLDQEVRLRFSDYLGLPMENIVTCTNATLAIEGAISTSNSNGIWGLPAWTFSATAAALNQAKGVGVFLDVDQDWRVVNDDTVPNLIDVLPFGQSFGDPLRYAEATLERLVVDAAASFDSCASQTWLNFPEFAGILSFHATKVLPSGEGGLFFSNSSEWAEEFRSWTRFGMRSERKSLTQGTNAKLSEYHAAVLLASLDNWKCDREIWLTQIARADELAKKYGYASTPQLNTKQAIPYWIVQDKLSSRIVKLKSVFENLRIDTRAWWESGCHQMPAYAHFKTVDLMNTNVIAAQTLGLPFWIDMDESVWRRVEFAFQCADEK